MISHLITNLKAETNKKVRKERRKAEGRKYQANAFSRKDCQFIKIAGLSKDLQI